MNARRFIRVVEAGMVILLVGALSAAAAESNDYFRKAKKPKTPPYALQASVGPKKPVFDIKNAAPGDKGIARVTIGNAGTKPARMQARRIRMTASTLTPHLLVSIYDSTTRECLYPKPKLPKPKPPKKKGKPVPRPKPSGPCKATGPWRNLSPRLELPPKPIGKFIPKGPAERLWKRKEKHVYIVTWEISKVAPNEAAGKSATFTFRWIAMKK